MNMAALRRLPAMVAIGLWLALPLSAAAHAAFVRSDPADVCGPLAQPRLQSNDPRCQTGVVLDQAPSIVRVTFSEPVQVVGRGIRVLSPSGRPVQQGKAVATGDEASVAVDASEPGTYVVQWQVTSEDTHPAGGQFAFSVGHPSPPAVGPSGSVGQVTPLGLALQAFSRWLHFAGYALGFGTLAVSLLLPRLTGPPLWRMTNAGIVLLVLAEPLALLGQTGSLGLDQLFDGDAVGDALAAPFGRLLGFRLAAALLLWVLAGSLSAPAGDEDTPTVNRRLAVGAALILGLALAVVDGLGQHAASFQPEWLGLIVHAAHLIGMAVWLAAVGLLVWAWRAGEPVRPLARIALGAFGLIALSGLAMAVAHFPTAGSLITSTYGQVLLAKQAVLVVAVLLARRRKLELGALTLLIGMAGLLVSLPPPR